MWELKLEHFSYLLSQTENFLSFDASLILSLFCSRNEQTCLEFWEFSCEFQKKSKKLVEFAGIDILRTIFTSAWKFTRCTRVVRILKDIDLKVSAIHKSFASHVGSQIIMSILLWFTWFIFYKIWNLKFSSDILFLMKVLLTGSASDSETQCSNGSVCTLHEVSRFLYFHPVM